MANSDSIFTVLMKGINLILREIGTKGCVRPKGRTGQKCTNDCIPLSVRVGWNGRLNEFVSSLDILAINVPLVTSMHYVSNLKISRYTLI